MARAVNFLVDDLELLVEEKGYDMNWEQMTICPCNNNSTNQPLSECVFCRGRGIYYYDTKQVKALKTAVTELVDMQDKVGEVHDGSCFITVNPENMPSYFDRYVDLNSISVFTEKAFKGKPLRYPVLTLKSVSAYKLTSIASEVLIASYDGELDVQIEFFPIKAGTYSVYYGGLKKTDKTDYTIDNKTGLLTFVTIPTTGVGVTISYSYYSITEYTVGTDVSVEQISIVGESLTASYNNENKLLLDNRDVNSSGVKIYYSGIEKTLHIDYEIVYNLGEVYFLNKPLLGQSVTADYSHVTGNILWTATEPDVYSIRYEHHPKWVVSGVPNVHRDTNLLKSGYEQFRQMPVKSRCILDHLANYEVRT